MSKRTRSNSNLLKKGRVQRDADLVNERDDMQKIKKEIQKINQAKLEIAKLRSHIKVLDSISVTL